MRATNSSSPRHQPGTSIRERIFGATAGVHDDALIFAASSIINEISRANAATVVREIETAEGSYVLHGTRIHADDAVQPVIMVYARPSSTPSPAIQHPRERFGLTRKEYRVAELLAQHKSNGQIAEALCISTHTARHHTQAVLNKLGLRSRRDVADLLNP